MANFKHPRLLITAAASGEGKTSVVCGLLKALADRGENPCAFKCGPDYIDPMFHSEVLNTPSRNMDLYFMDENTVKYLLHRNGRSFGTAIMEGVMGYYDGLGGRTAEASSYHLAKATKTPVVLVVNAKGTSLSAAAIVKGFLSFRPDSGIRGVILNNVSPGILPLMKDYIEGETGVKVFGCLPTMAECSLESRHLGLITAAEVENLQEVVRKLGRAVSENIDIDGLLELAKGAPELTYEVPKTASINKGMEAGSGDKVPIAIARDKAFCFYYEDSLELLTDMGVKLIPFSPLADQGLPEGIRGLIIGGGYPELYGEELARNKSMLADIKRATDRGMPCFAECGGFMYLHESLTDAEGCRHRLVGAIPGNCHPTGKLVRFGYAEFTARRDTTIAGKGWKIKGHEFHYWESENPGESFEARKPHSGKSWNCIYTEKSIVAGFPHFHFHGNPDMAEKFIESCRVYGSI